MGSITRFRLFDHTLDLQHRHAQALCSAILHPPGLAPDRADIDVDLGTGADDKQHEQSLAPSPDAFCERILPAANSLPAPDQLSWPGFADPGRAFAGSLAPEAPLKPESGEAPGHAPPAYSHWALSQSGNSLHADSRADVSSPAHHAPKSSGGRQARGLLEQRKRSGSPAGSSGSPDCESESGNGEDAVTLMAPMPVDPLTRFGEAMPGTGTGTSAEVGPAGDTQGNKLMDVPSSPAVKDERQENAAAAANAASAQTPALLPVHLSPEDRWALPPLHQRMDMHAVMVVCPGFIATADDVLCLLWA